MLRRSRPVLSVPLALVLVVIFVTSGSPGAWAVDCSDGHCFGRIKWDPSASNDGGKMVLNVECLEVPDPYGVFVVAALWVYRNQNWFEHGMTYGANYGADRVWFWADRRPGHPYREDAVPLAHALNTDYGNKIVHDSQNPSWWNFFHEANHYRTSKDGFSDQSNALFAGVESLTDDARVIVHVKDAEWRDGQGDWHSPWEGGGVDDPVLQNTQDLFNIYWITRNKSATIKLNAQQC